LPLLTSLLIILTDDQGYHDVSLVKTVFVDI